MSLIKNNKNMKKSVMEKASIKLNGVVDTVTLIEENMSMLILLGVLWMIN